jgi:hypothetical protein
VPCRDGVWLENKKTLAAVQVEQQGHAADFFLTRKNIAPKFPSTEDIYLGIQLILANGNVARD